MSRSRPCHAIMVGQAVQATERILLTAWVRAWMLSTLQATATAIVAQRSSLTAYHSLVMHTGPCYDS